MSFAFETEEVTEGKARLLVPLVARRKGPGTRSAEPYYAPGMVLNRDLTVLVVDAFFGGRRATALDGLTGVGVAGIRWALEAGVAETTLNDADPAAAELARTNADRNGVALPVENRRLNALLAERRFDFVDIDPFGTPAPYLDLAVRSVRDGGLLAATATDTAPLCGAKPAACVRRYGARPLRCPFGHEVALRILIGHIVRTAARYERSFEPLLSFSADYYFRVVGRVAQGAGRADASLRWMSRVKWNPKTGRRELVTERLAEPEDAGPLWGGALLDATFVRRLAVHDTMPPRSGWLLDRLRREADGFPFYYTNDELSSRFRRQPPRLDALVDALRGAGFDARRTHFHSNAVKTDAPIEALRDTYASASGQ